MTAPQVSFVMPVRDGESMLDEVVAQLLEFESALPDGGTIEIIAVDDGSRDNSWSKLLELRERHPSKLRAIKLSRGHGSSPAFRAGLAQARGDCVAMVQQDLQEPPELYKRMFDQWSKGTKVSIGFCEASADSLFGRLRARLNRMLLQPLVGSRHPCVGARTCLFDRQVADALRKQPEPADVATQLLAMGYSQALHQYQRNAPAAGAKRKTPVQSFRLVVDALLSFSYLPARLMSSIGILLALASMAFAGYVLIGKSTGWYVIDQPPGWATIVVLLTFLNGIVMLMLGIVGEYLWRIFDAVRNRPMYLIDEDSSSES